MRNERGHPYSVYSGGAPGTSTPSALARLRAIRAASARPPERAQVLTGARILPFRSSRPDGEPYRLRMDRDYTTDAVRDGEPCPTCQSTDWRLVSGGLWLCGSSLHYWAPARPTGASS